MSDLTPLAAQAHTAPAPDQPDEVLKLHAEEVVVSRRRVDGDIVRVRTTVHSREELVEEELNHERVDVRRVAVGRVVERIPDIRQEGELTIIPVVEEEIVIQRRLVLKEEVHIRRHRLPELHRETVVIRREEALIERIAVVGSVQQP